MSLNLMFRVESVELSVTQMCIYCFVILEWYVERLIVYYRISYACAKRLEFTYTYRRVFTCFWDIAFAV